MPLSLGIDVLLHCNGYEATMTLRFIAPLSDLNGRSNPATPTSTRSQAGYFLPNSRVELPPLQLEWMKPPLALPGRRGCVMGKLRWLLALPPIFPFCFFLVREGINSSRRRDL
ncbi:hypothetical protein ACLOJK_012024 [Asimina triloba]